MSEKQAVAEQKKCTMALMQIETSQLEETFRANFEDEEIAGTLDRVRMPSGGQTVWTIETLEGEEAHPDEIRGVIISFNKSRVYWKSDFEDVSGPPDCVSHDGRTGEGNPGGICKLCPLSKFGENNESPPCREQRIVFILPEENILPIAMVLPPTSIFPFKKYLTRLGSKAIPVFSVITSFKLEKETSSGGIKYSKLKISMAEKLEREEIEKIKTYSEKIKTVLSSHSVLDDYANPEASENTEENFDFDGDIELTDEDIPDTEPKKKSPLISAEDWWNRLPEKESMVGHWQSSMTQRFYMAMQNIGFDKPQAKLWAEQALGMKEGSIVTMKDIVINGDHLFTLNQKFFEEYKTPLYGEAVVD